MSHRRDAKFVHITALPGYDDNSVDGALALDEDGNVWVRYGFQNTNQWGQENMWVAVTMVRKITP